MVEIPKTRGSPTDSWSTPFTAFNSMKYLMYKEWIESIIAQDYKWHPEVYKKYNKKIIRKVERYSQKYDKLLPPYMIDIDPSNLCNYDCKWCNSKKFRQESSGAMMPKGHLFKIADFMKKWGVNSTCVSGGGEPMIHPEFSSFLYYLQKNDIENGVICNGSYVDEINARAVVDTSSWCGFSIDAGTEETYSMIHNVPADMFQKVLDNIRLLIDLKKERKSSIEVTYKFLLHPWNAGEIMTAVKLAKEVGFNTFHLRPVCWDNLYGQGERKPVDYSPYIDLINKQINEAQDLEDNDFKFYGIRHKFGARLERRIGFERCLATPMMATFAADGNVYLCFDVRGRPDWILCKHYPNPDEIFDVWGSEKHRLIIESIRAENCPRCTFGFLNEIIEQVFIEDKMFKDFL